MMSKEIQPSSTLTHLMFHVLLILCNINPMHVKHPKLYIFLLKSILLTQGHIHVTLKGYVAR